MPQMGPLPWLNMWMTLFMSIVYLSSFLYFYISACKMFVKSTCGNSSLKLWKC